MVNLSTDKITLLAITIPMVLLLFTGYISYENTIRFIQKDVLTDRINLIIQKLEHLISTITDVETGQRGFIITNRPNYLEPYNSAVRDIHNQLRNLDMLMANEPFNHQSSINELNVLKGLIKSKLTELNQTIGLHQLQGINVALPIILSDRGKILMDKIRAISNNIESQQNNTSYIAARHAHAMTSTITLTTLIACLTGVSIFAISRGIRNRHLTIQRSLQTQVNKRTEELHVANNQLIVANEQLKLHDKMQQEFINIAAHELRTPAQSILGYAELAKPDPQYMEKHAQSFLK